MKIKITNSSKPLSDDDLKALEMQIDTKIPDGYKTFLKSFNGGSTGLATFKLNTDDWNEEISVERFLGISENEYFDLEKTYNNYKKILPHDLFPIALVGGSSLICIKNTGEGSIYFWDSEEFTVKDQNYYFVAKSLKDFLHILEPCK